MQRGQQQGEQVAYLNFYIHIYDNPSYTQSLLTRFMRLNIYIYVSRARLGKLGLLNVCVYIYICV